MTTKQTDQAKMKTGFRWGGVCGCAGVPLLCLRLFFPTNGIQFDFILLFLCSFLITLMSTLWSRTAKNTDCSNGPIARPFGRLLALLTRLLVLDGTLCSHPLLRSLVRSLAHFAHSLAHGTVNDWMAIYSVFSILAHSAFTYFFVLT